MIKIMRKLVCVVFIGAVLCSGYGSVLCYGQDGHIAIEPVFHDHCHHDGHKQDRAEHEHPAATMSNTCNPCEDVALGYDMEPIRLHNMIQFAQVDFNIRFSNNFIASSGIFDQQSNICAFFTPLKTIRLLT